MRACGRHRGQWSSGPAAPWNSGRSLAVRTCATGFKQFCAGGASQFLSAIEPVSLVAQRFDRIEIGGFERGIGAEDDSHHRTDQQAEEDPINRDERSEENTSE